MVEVIISTLVTLVLILIYDYFRVYKITVRMEEEIERLEEDVAKLRLDMLKHVSNFKAEFRKIS